MGCVTRVRIALLAGVLALATAFFAPTAFACARGYSYAGLYSTSTASGIGATLSMVDTPNIATGHVAGWVGVGGPGLGPNGTDEWLQVGLASFSDSPDGHLYYELTRPGKEPEYTELASGIQPGAKLRVALLELPFSPNTWIVISPAGIAGPFYLPRSHKRWEPIATAESWDAGGSQCNRFAYRFGGIELARQNGSWHALHRGRKLQDPRWLLHRETGSTFQAVAA